MGNDTVSSTVAADLHIGHLFADPNFLERDVRGIQSDYRLDIVMEYGAEYPEIKMWPQEPSKENLPIQVWKEYDKRTSESNRMRERVWLEKIVGFDKWPLLFVCGANHFREFSKLLAISGYHVIETYEDWTSPNQ